MTMIKNGLNKPKLLDQSHLINLITTALPHHTAYIQKHGEDAAHYLLDELEQSILRELRAMISGADRDDANLKLVADIHSRVEAMQQATVQAAAEAAPIN
ncbi:hypothetical protein [Permianibacter aggregans]|nr:hypothetical protein [Permianibacter aggregans]QGX41528.1 hypothetical protein E2H98_18380 [Permianibacter aggregans]